MNAQDVSGPAILGRLKSYEAASATLMRMAFVAGQWSESAQLAPWVKAITKLAFRRATGGIVLWLELQRYPATLLLYCFGLGAVTADRWEALHALFSATIAREHREDQRAVEIIPIWALFERGADAMKELPGREREYTPLQNHMEALLLPLFQSQFPSEAAFNLAFDRFEVLAALSYAIPAIEKGEQYWTLPGSYGWRRENRQRIINEVRDSLTTMGDNSPLVKSRLVGKSAESALKNLTEFERFVPLLRWR